MSIKAFMFLAVMLLLTACGSGRNASAGTSEKLPSPHRRLLLPRARQRKLPLKLRQRSRSPLHPPKRPLPKARKILWKTIRSPSP